MKNIPIGTNIPNINVKVPNNKKISDTFGIDLNSGIDSINKEVNTYNSFGSSNIAPVTDMTLSTNQAAYSNKYDSVLSKQFFTNKTVVTNNQFEVYFNDSFENNTKKKNLYALIGNMPPIKPWHIKDISIDSMTKSFDTMYVSGNTNERQMTITISFEEDASYNVAAFIEWYHKKTMNADGVLRSWFVNHIDNITIKKFRNNLDISTPNDCINYIFRNVRFMSATPMANNYDDSGTATYVVVLWTDTLEIQNNDVYNNINRKM